LTEVFEDKEDEWTMVAKKAKTWLKEQGINKSFYVKMCTEAGLENKDREA